MTRTVIILQYICIVAVSLGILIELTFGATIGFLLITGGTFAFAIAAKLHK
jgi:hypothetical protein